ncbi:tetratricopeptide repeat protein, partial [Candidatus Acetothermia bacterium]|nr:tetratricopeptide repeat protein [Candidatus Acetothermia bacterium]
KLLYGMLKSGELGELGQWVYERSKGIPFFAVELIKSFIEAGVLSLDEQECWQVERAKFTAEYIPSTVRSLIEMRLRRLSQLSRQVLDVAAVTSRAFTTELLAQTMGRQPEDMFDRIDELLRARVIVRDDSRYDFRHDLIRQVIYGTLLPERKQHLHKHVGEALERTHAQRLDEIAGELAYHFLQAELWPQAMEYSLRAGERAWKAYAKQEALDALHRALELAEKLKDTQGMMRAYKGLGQVCCFTDKHEVGLQYSLKALELCKDLYQRVDIYHAIANVYHHKSDYEKALEYYQTSIRELGSDNKSIEMGKLLDQACTALLYLRRYDEVIEYETRSLEILKDTDQLSALAQVYTHIGSAYRGKGDYANAVEYGMKAVEMAEDSSDLYAMAPAYWWLANLYSYKGDSERAAEWFKKSLDAYSEMNDMVTVAWCHMYLNHEYMQLNRLDEAISHTQKKLEVWNKMGEANEIAKSLGILGCLYDAQDRTDESKNAFAKAMELAARDGSLYTRIVISYTLLGESDKAIEWLQKGIQLIPVSQLKYLKEHPWFDSLRSDPRFHAILENQKH